MNKDLIVQAQRDIAEQELADIAAMTTGELVFALEEILTLEEFSGFTTAKNLFKNLVSRFMVPNAKNAPIKYLLSQRDVNTATQKLTKIKIHNLSQFMVYVPEGLTGTMVAYLEFLNTAISELGSVDARILRPLELWAGQLISDPSFATKVWVNTFGAGINTTKINDDIKGFFNPGSKEAQVSIAAYPDVYVNNSDISDTNSILGKLVNTSDGLLNGLLSERVTAVSKLIQRAMESENFDKVPRERIKPIIKLATQAATELELLSMLIFQVKSAANAYTNTINKINKELK